MPADHVGAELAVLEVRVQRLSGGCAAKAGHGINLDLANAFARQGDPFPNFVEGRRVAGGGVEPLAHAHDGGLPWGEDAQEFDDLARHEARNRLRVWRGQVVAERVADGRVDGVVWVHQIVGAHPG